MPKFLPWHFELIIASGVTEILLGLGVFFKKFRKISLIGIILMLTIFLIVHFNMLIPENSLGNPTYLLLIRIVIQFGLIYWAWRNID
jgi:uncharacterized membrane protein